MKEKVIKILYTVYIALFIFTMVNREFLLFGLDMRFVILPLGALLVLYSFFKPKTKLDYKPKDSKLINIFYIYAIISNISWLWNGIEMNTSKFINEMLLICNVFISILVLNNYKEYFDKKKINIFIIISVLILTLSMAVVSFGVPLEDIGGAPDVHYIYEADETAPDNKNLYGGDFRAAGFASDPNYATLLILIGSISVIQLKMKRFFKFILLAIFFGFMGLSCSKTILAACVVGLIFVGFIRILKPSTSIMKKINLAVVLLIITGNILMPKISALRDFMPSTLTMRFDMWKQADNLFKESPVIGNGITSFRSYFAQKYWYVQSHSTYWQILSELGIIGLLIFAKILYDRLNLHIEKGNYSDYFLTFVYIVYAMTCETIAMQFIVVFLCLTNYEIQEKRKGKKALFMINTLSNGGAERVCINMANELVRQDYKVDFIILGKNDQNNISYEFNKSIKVYDLKINETNKIKKLLKIFLAIGKVDTIIKENEKEEKYSLITSHLPMSNIVSRLSVVSNRTIYVFHNKIATYDRVKSKILFRILLKYMFNNKKVATVSNGVRKEAIEDYNFKQENVKTIYNPINIEEIEKKKTEKTEKIGKYIVCVGRFNDQKRQDRMVEVFYKGKFYEKYKLVFCGTGDLEDKVKARVKELGLQESVLFLGWQSNVYKWIENAELLVCTSDYEAFPMNLIEACACKTKIVSSNCNYGPNEILLGKYAEYLVNTEDLDDYVEKINKALEVYPTEVNEIVEKCKAENVIKEYIDFM